MAITSDNIVSEALTRSSLDTVSVDERARVKTVLLESALEELFHGKRFKSLEKTDDTIALAINSHTFTLPSDFGLSKTLYFKYTTSPIQWDKVDWVDSDRWEELMILPDTESDYPYAWTIEDGVGKIFPQVSLAWTLRLKYYIDILTTTESSHATLRSNLYTQYKEPLIIGLMYYILSTIDDDRQGTYFRLWKIQQKRVGGLELMLRLGQHTRLLGSRLP